MDLKPVVPSATAGVHHQISSTGHKTLVPIRSGSCCSIRHFQSSTTTTNHRACEKGLLHYSDDRSNKTIKSNFLGILETNWKHRAIKRIPAQEKPAESHQNSSVALWLILVLFLTSWWPSANPSSSGGSFSLNNHNDIFGPVWWLHDGLGSKGLPYWSS